MAGRRGVSGGFGTSGAAGLEAGPGDGGYVHHNPQRGLSNLVARGRRQGIVTSGVVRELAGRRQPVFAMQSLGRPVLAEPAKAAHAHTLLAIAELTTKVRNMPGHRQDTRAALLGALDSPGYYRSPLSAPLPKALGPTSNLAPYRRGYNEDREGTAAAVRWW